MEEKLDLIIQKLDELLYLAKRIHKDTEPSTENNVWQAHNLEVESLPRAY